MPRNYVAAAADLTAVADAIRAKASTANALTFPAGFISAVEGISATGNTPAESGLNITWGDTEPEIADGLWIKSAEPSRLLMTPDALPAAESMECIDSYLPVAAYSMGAGTAGKKIYLLGGQSNETIDMDTVVMFDTDSQEVTTLPTTLPAGLREIEAAAATVGEKIYLFGGTRNNTKQKTIVMFDTESQTATTLSVTLPQATNSIAAAGVGNKVYLFGGSTSSGYLRTIIEFDTESQTVTTLSATLSKAMCGVTAAAVGTKVYLFGGYASGYLQTIAVFDTESQTVTTLSATLPQATSGVAAAVVGAKVYLFGGYGSSGSYLQTIAVFDTESQTITTLPVTLPQAAGGVAAAAVGTKVYLFGGRYASVGNLNTINVFSAVSELEKGLMYLETSFSGDLINLVSNDAVTVKMGVTAAWLGDENNAAQPVEAAIAVGGQWISL